jgi:fluoride ion exporter CrcB/FEX
VRATAVVNVLGAGALGVAVVALHGTSLVVVGGGLLGALTTFSTWMVQADRAARPLLVAVVPLVCGVAAAALGAAGAGAVGLGA